MGNAKSDPGTVHGGQRTHSMALPYPSPQHMTDFDFVLRYWKQQGTLQRMYCREGVSASKHVTSRSSAWAKTTLVLEYIHSLIHIRYGTAEH